MHELFKDEQVTAHIYHVQGIKIGCTIDPKRRKSELKLQYGKNISFELIETITASRREIADLEDYHSQRLGYGCIRVHDRYDSEGMYLHHSSEVRQKQRDAMRDHELRSYLRQKAKKQFSSEESRKEASEVSKNAWENGNTRRNNLITRAKRAIFVSFDGSPKEWNTKTKRIQFKEAKAIEVTLSKEIDINRIHRFLSAYERFIPKMTFINKSPHTIPV
ncbi:hypothetical protein [Vibrio harveyi]|uniref:hypothetical protein n=1 Tax=Vibrio harveyi TaxID=669 RepID=UPI00042432F9|nr:hypothetical protein [Vibrio harveyi]